MANSTYNDYSYLIYKNGSTVNAKNGNTSNIEFSSIDAATVIQNAIDRKSTKGKIFIKNGSYNIARQINIPDSDIIVDSDNAELKLANTSLNESIFNLNNNTHSVSISNLWLNGNNPPDNNGNRGIYGTGKNVIVSKCKFDNWGLNHPVGLGFCNTVLLENNRVGDSAGFGSEGGCNLLRIVNNKFTVPTKDYAIMAAGNMARNNRVWIIGNDISCGSVNAGGCIDVVGNDFFISNNFMRKPFQHGIYVHDNNLLGGIDEIQRGIVSDNIILGRNGPSGFSIQVEQPNDSTASNIIIKNNIVDRGLGFTNVNNMTVEGNILVGNDISNVIYTIRGSKHDYYNNIFQGQYAFAIEPSVTFVDNVSLRNNRFDITLQRFVNNNIPTNLQESDNT